MMLVRTPSSWRVSRYRLVSLVVTSSKRLASSRSLSGDRVRIWKYSEKDLAPRAERRGPRRVSKRYLRLSSTKMPHLP